jgi:hypothetical protein
MARRQIVIVLYSAAASLCQYTLPADMLIMDRFEHALPYENERLSSWLSVRRLTITSAHEHNPRRIDAHVKKFIMDYPLQFGVSFDRRDLGFAVKHHYAAMYRVHVVSVNIKDVQGKIPELVALVRIGLNFASANHITSIGFVVQPACVPIVLYYAGATRVKIFGADDRIDTNIVVVEDSAVICHDNLYSSATTCNILLPYISQQRGAGSLFEGATKVLDHLRRVDSRRRRHTHTHMSKDGTFAPHDVGKFARLEHASSLVRMKIEYEMLRQFNTRSGVTNCIRFHDSRVWNPHYCQDAPIRYAPLGGVSWDHIYGYDTSKYHSTAKKWKEYVSGAVRTHAEYLSLVRNDDTMPILPASFYNDRSIEDFIARLM